MCRARKQAENCRKQGRIIVIHVGNVYQNEEEKTEFTSKRSSQRVCLELALPAHKNKQFPLAEAELSKVNWTVTARFMKSISNKSRDGEYVRLNK